MIEVHCIHANVLKLHGSSDILVELVQARTIVLLDVVLSIQCHGSSKLLLAEGMLHQLIMLTLGHALQSWRIKDDLRLTCLHHHIVIDWHVVQSSWRGWLVPYILLFRLGLLRWWLE